MRHSEVCHQVKYFKVVIQSLHIDIHKYNGKNLPRETADEVQKKSTFQIILYCFQSVNLKMVVFIECHMHANIDVNPTKCSKNIQHDPDGFLGMQKGKK